MPQEQGSLREGCRSCPVSALRSDRWRLHPPDLQCRQEERGQKVSGPHEPYRRHDGGDARRITNHACSKRKGLEKALFQVEEALKRAGPGVQGTDANKAITELKSMLAAGQEGQLNGGSEGGNKRPRLATNGSSEMQDSSSDEDDSPRSQKDSLASVGRRESMVSQRPVKPEERLAVDDVENPLQLLARASNLHLSPESSHGQSPGTAVSHQAASSVADDLDPEMRQVEIFFGTTNFNVDRGDDYDPIELGLVTEDEAEMLFDL